MSALASSKGKRKRVPESYHPGSTLPRANYPADWRICRLEEIIDIKGGSQPPKSEFISEPKEGYVRLLQIRDFGDKPVPTYVPKDRVTKFCDKDDVFIARYGASLGRILTGMEGAYNVALAKVIFDRDEISSRYMFYLLQTKYFQTPIHMISRSAQNGFNKGEINPIEVPIAPRDQQDRIVAEIEKQFSRLDEAVASLKRVKANLKRYKAAVLKAAVEGKLVDTEGEFERLEMRDLGQLHCGQSPASKDVNTEGDGTLYVTGPEQWDGHSVHESKWTTDPRRIVPNGCIFITVKGSGVGTLFPGIACAIGRDVYAFEPNDRCLSGYVELALQASINDVLRHASGDIPGLSKRHILDHEIGVPSLATQKEILVKVDEVLSLGKVAARSVENDLKRLDRLRQSVLARAFSSGYSEVTTGK